MLVLISLHGDVIREEFCFGKCEIELSTPLPLSAAMANLSANAVHGLGYQSFVRAPARYHPFIFLRLRANTAALLTAND